MSDVRQTYQLQVQHREPEESRNQSDASDMHTNTQSIMDDLRRSAHMSETVRNSQNDPNASDFPCGSAAFEMV